MNTAKNYKLDSDSKLVRIQILLKREQINKLDTISRGLSLQRGTLIRQVVNGYLSRRKNRKQLNGLKNLLTIESMDNTIRESVESGINQVLENRNASIDDVISNGLKYIR